MVVHRITWRLTWRERLEKLFRQLEGPLNACIDVVTLLEVYVFKQVAADRTGGNRISVHLDSWQMRNRTFYRHEPLTQIFIDGRIRVRFCRRNAFLVLQATSPFPATGSVLVCIDFTRSAAEAPLSKTLPAAVNDWLTSRDVAATL